MEETRDEPPSGREGDHPKDGGRSLRALTLRCLNRFGLMANRDASGGLPPHIVDGVSEISETRGGLNRRKKNDG